MRCRGQEKRPGNQEGTQREITLWKTGDFFQKEVFFAFNIAELINDGLVLLDNEENQNVNSNNRHQKPSEDIAPIRICSNLAVLNSGIEFFEEICAVEKFWVVGLVLVYRCRKRRKVG